MATRAKKPTKLVAAFLLVAMCICIAFPFGRTPQAYASNGDWGDLKVDFNDFHGIPISDISGLDFYYMQIKLSHLNSVKNYEKPQLLRSLSVDYGLHFSKRRVRTTQVIVQFPNAVYEADGKNYQFYIAFTTQIEVPYRMALTDRSVKFLEDVSTVSLSNGWYKWIMYNRDKLDFTTVNIHVLLNGNYAKLAKVVSNYAPIQYSFDIPDVDFSVVEDVDPEITNPEHPDNDPNLGNTGDQTIPEDENPQSPPLKVRENALAYLWRVLIDAWKNVLGGTADIVNWVIFILSLPIALLAIYLLTLFLRIFIKLIAVVIKSISKISSLKT